MTSVPTGPFETEDDARTDPAVRSAYKSGDLQAASYAMLDGACSSAGVRTGDYDRVILYWLAGYEPQMCAVIAGIIRRAAQPAAELREHLDADHAALVKLARVADLLSKTAETAIETLEHISMDTDEDRELHARAIANLRRPLETARAAMREIGSGMTAEPGEDQEHGQIRG